MSPRGPLDTLRKVGTIVALSLMLSAPVASSWTRADEPARDDDRAPRAGEVAPLQALLARIREDFNGRILEVEIEQEWRPGGRIWVYEAKLLTPHGHVLKLDYDAKTLELLDWKGRQGRKRRHRRGGDHEYE